MTEALGEARRWLEEHVPAGARVLCALSGGRDSMVLLHLLVRCGFSVSAAHLHHGLRGPEADRDQRFVADWCAAAGIPLETERVDAGGFAAAEGLSLEEAGRRLRYDFLEGGARRQGADYIATGHHLADQAETVLWNLIRGTGLDGLRGIAPVRGRVIRPLLSTAPEELAAYAAANGIPYVEDGSNRDFRYSRNRLRLQVLPVLRELNSAALENICRAARAAAEDAAWLRQEAEDRLRSLGEPIPYARFHEQPLALRKAQVRLLLETLPGGRRDVTAGQIEAAARLKRGGFLPLPGGLYAAAEEGWFTVGRRAPARRAELTRGCPMEWGDYTLTLLDRRAGEGLALRPGPETVAVAPCDPGERLTLPGTRGGARTVKRLCLDRRIPLSERAELPAVYVGGQLAAVWPLGVDERFLPAGDACRFVQLERKRPVRRPATGEERVSRWEMDTEETEKQKENIK